MVINNWTILVPYICEAEPCPPMRTQHINKNVKILQQLFWTKYKLWLIIPALQSQTVSQWKVCIVKGSTLCQCSIIVLEPFSND